MFALIYFSARFRLLLGFDFTVSCIILLGPMEWVKRDRLKALGLAAGSTGQLTDGRRIDGQLDELMVDRWTKYSRTDIV